MATIIRDHGFTIAPLMQEMAIFFSYFGIPSGGSNRYTELLRALPDRSEVLWSSLNYECLLEIAGSQMGCRINYFAEPSPSKEDLAVWKLHGSCNFKVQGLSATRGVQFGTGVVFGGGIEPIDPSQVAPTYQGDNALYPAMALYAENKPISMSPAPIEDAQRRWGEAVLRAKSVAVIGVRPNVADKHIWASLSQTSGTLGYVGSDREFAVVREQREGRHTKHLGQTWSSAAKSLIEFLK